MKIITTREHSYFIDNLATAELGSVVFDTEKNKFYILLAPNELVEVGVKTIAVDTLEKMAEAITAGGNVKIVEDIVAPTGFAVTADAVITNDKTISIPEDTEGNGVFCVSAGTLILNGTGTINGLGKNDWNIAVWAKDDGKVIINDGYFTNVGASSIEDSEHFDLIYASGNAQIEINGGEFKCETPKWTLNIKDKDRTTANIVVKGGKFHGFNPSNCNTEGANTSFVAPGYKVVEEDDVFIVMAE